MKVKVTLLNLCLSARCPLQLQKPQRFSLLFLRLFIVVTFSSIIITTMPRVRRSFLTTCTSLTFFRSFSAAFVAPSVLLPRKQLQQQPFLANHRLFRSITSMSSYKRAKLDDTKSDKVIGTHSGTFQSDEVRSGLSADSLLCCFVHSNLC